MKKRRTPQQYVFYRQVPSINKSDEEPWAEVGKFIIRSKENRKFEEVESFLETEKPLKWDVTEVIKDIQIKLFTGDNPDKSIQHLKTKMVESFFRP